MFEFHTPMEDKKVISKFQSLKQIKPNKEWAFLLKNEILANNVNIINKQVENKFDYKWTFSGVLNLFFQRKLAYVVTAFLFVVSGLFGFVNVLPNNEAVKITEQSPASLSKSNIKSNINVSSNIKEVESVVKSLTSAIQKNPKIAKDIAIELKNNGTFAYLNREKDLRENSDVLYKTLVETIIKDLENTTLNENQQDVFIDIKNLYDDEKYSDALEKILIEF